MNPSPQDRKLLWGRLLGSWLVAFLTSSLCLPLVYLLNLTGFRFLLHGWEAVDLFTSTMAARIAWDLLLMFLLPVAGTSAGLAVLTTLSASARKWATLLVAGIAANALAAILVIGFNDLFHYTQYFLLVVMVLSSGILTGWALSRFYGVIDQRILRAEES